MSPIAWPRGPNLWPLLHFGLVALDALFPLRKEKRCPCPDSFNYCTPNYGHKLRTNRRTLLVWTWSESKFRAQTMFISSPLLAGWIINGSVEEHNLALEDMPSSWKVICPVVDPNSSSIFMVRKTFLTVHCSCFFEFLHKQ